MTATTPPEQRQRAAQQWLVPRARLSGRCGGRRGGCGRRGHLRREFGSVVGERTAGRREASPGARAARPRSTPRVGSTLRRSRRSDSAGKVVLYDFWTYSCINCRRTFPYLRSWFDRYRADGLVVVGIHSPEFDFEKVHKNVEAAAKRLDVTWPVALDDDMTIWDALREPTPGPPTTSPTGAAASATRTSARAHTPKPKNVIRQLLGVAPTAPRASKVTQSARPHRDHDDQPRDLSRNPAEPPARLDRRFAPARTTIRCSGAGSLQAPLAGARSAAWTGHRRIRQIRPHGRRRSCSGCTRSR